VRLQAGADRAASKQIGDSRNRGKAVLGAFGAAIARAGDAALLEIGEMRDRRRLRC
jgi:hypothetical protein